MTFDAEGKVKRVELEATVIRADGQREELGKIADTSRRWRWLGSWRARRRIERANRKAT